jgi:Zn-dependent protease
MTMSNSNETNWMEWQQETCRGGRQLVTAINRRAGHAMYIDPADLDDVLSAELELCESTSGPAQQPGAGLVWHGADRFVRVAHDVVLHRFFRRGWVIAQIVVAIAGAAAISAVIFGGRMDLHAEPGQIPAIIVLGLVAVALHELGHAVVTVHYGRSVRAAGLRLHLGSPAFYVESLDALLLSRRQRIVQAAAGPWAEWLVTSCAAFALLALQPHSAAALVLHRFVIVNTITIASNLVPFVGLDGALILADIIREPDLMLRARASVLRRPAGVRRERWLVAYAAANSVVAAALLVIAGFFWWQLFGSLVSSLWAVGPVGVAIVIAVAGALARQVARMVAAMLSTVGPQLMNLRLKLAFRSERRWRVRAMKALRVIPEIGRLDTEALGILAGRVRRVCGRSGSRPVSGDYVYVRRATSIPSGAVIQLDSTSELGGDVDVVVLPQQWRQFLASC